LLSAFAQQLHSTVIVSLHVLDPHGESFGHSGAGIIEKKKEQMIAPFAPGILNSKEARRATCGNTFVSRKKAPTAVGMEA